MPMIGIDLGTTNSLISSFTSQGVVIIPNALGENLTPSVVSIDEKGNIYVGKIAKEMQITNPDRTISVFKRSMGSKKEFTLGERKFLPEELSSLILKSLKEDAEIYLGEQVCEAVISVPAYFNDVQRRATKRAGELAGLRVSRLISEPTAAAIAYGLQERREHTKFLILDLGGGTFDVSILELNKNIMEVRAVAGDNYLGGEEFTETILNLFINYHGLNKEQLDKKNLETLKRQSEKAKLDFYSNKVVTINCKIKDRFLSYELSISDYEKACQSLLNRLRIPIERALSDSSIKIREIDSILLVGGATKLSIVRSFVGKIFGKLPLCNINPDEVVAMGAGVQAAMKARETSIKEIILTDVCPYTLGTNTAIEKPGGVYESGHFCPIIERNTVIPVSRIERLYTIYENQKEVSVEILQGESRRAEDNIYLGELVVSVPPGKRGEQCIDVRYTYDINGILEVEVTVVKTNIKKSMIIEKNPGYMSREEIEARMEELSYLKIHPKDQEENKLLLAKGERLYEECLGDVRQIIDVYLSNFEAALDTQDRGEIEEAAQELMELVAKIEEDKGF